MKILALEFSSIQRSVAVIQQGNPAPADSVLRSCANTQNSVNEVIETGGVGGHTLGMTESVLREAGVEREQIDLLAIGLGPGSYSGIRRAIATAQGWQLACGDRIKLLGIGSVDGMVAQAEQEGLTGRFNIVIDAQRGEFYLAIYEIRPDGSLNVEPLRLATVVELKEREGRGENFFGPEAGRFRNGRIAFPRASALGLLGLKRTDFVSGERLEPIYLRATQFVKSQPKIL